MKYWKSNNILTCSLVTISQSLDWLNHLFNKSDSSIKYIFFKCTPFQRVLNTALWYKDYHLAMTVPSRINMCPGEPQPERVDMKAKKSNNSRGISQFQSLQNNVRKSNGFWKLSQKWLSFTFYGFDLLMKLNIFCKNETLNNSVEFISYNNPISPQ